MNRVSVYTKKSPMMKEVLKPIGKKLHKSQNKYKNRIKPKRWWDKTSAVINLRRKCKTRTPQLSSLSTLSPYLLPETIPFVSQYLLGSKQHFQKQFNHCIDEINNIQHRIDDNNQRRINNLRRIDDLNVLMYNQAIEYLFLDQHIEFRYVSRVVPVLPRVPGGIVDDSYKRKNYLRFIKDSQFIRFKQLPPKYIYKRILNQYIFL